MTSYPSAQPSPSFFQDKVIVITGGGGNFGREASLYFARRGAKVAALDMNEETLEETAKCVQSELSSPAATTMITTCTCDVTDPKSVQDAVDHVVQTYGRIDLCWNNAGYQGHIQPTLKYDPKDFAAVMNINVTGMFIVLQAVARQMVAQQQEETSGAADGASTSSSSSGGPSYSICNTASVAGLVGTAAMPAYSSSKAAVLAMTVSCSKDLAPHGIRVNAVSPALIGPGYMWDRQNELHASSGSPYFATDPETVAKNKVNSVPLKRLGSIEEVVKSVAFLLSDEASYTTGINLVVDGGISSGLRA